jgi:hypothetical protein
MRSRSYLVLILGAFLLGLLIYPLLVGPAPHPSHERAPRWR